MDAAMDAPPPDLARAWAAEQDAVAARVVRRDDALSWALDARGTPAAPLLALGCDVSFAPGGGARAVATLAGVALLPGGGVRVAYSASRAVCVDVPYVPTFLGFREAPAVAEMVGALPRGVRERVGVLLLDGNGELHPRAAGLACQVGVGLGLPTVGVGKTLMCVDGLVEREVRAAVAGAERGAAVPIVGRSGRVWGNAMLTGNAETKPLFVSVGHRVGLETATRLVRALCRYRVPEPIRLADMHSREALRENFVEIDRLEEFGFK